MAGGLALEVGEAFVECEGGLSCGLDVCGDVGELLALVVELAVEAGVGGGDLTEISAKTFSHLLQGGAGGVGVGCLGIEEAVGEGEQTRDVRSEFDELR